MSKATEERRMIEMAKKRSAELRELEQGMDHGRDTHEHDLTFENEQSTVTIPLKEYDRLKSQSNYITDPSLIGAIDKIEFFVKELRKHIVRKF